MKDEIKELKEKIKLMKEYLELLEKCKELEIPERKECIPMPWTPYEPYVPWVIYPYSDGELCSNGYIYPFR